MNENKRKRYPIDRLKLRTLLEKKEQEALELQEEVEHLRQMVKQADIDALVAVAEMYDLTPEELAQMMASIRSDRSQPEADIPDSITAVPAEPEQIMFPEEEDPLALSLSLNLSSLSLSAIYLLGISEARRRRTWK